MVGDAGPREHPGHRSRPWHITPAVQGAAGWASPFPAGTASTGGLGQKQEETKPGFPGSAGQGRRPPCTVPSAPAVLRSPAPQ